MNFRFLIVAACALVLPTQATANMQTEVVLQDQISRIFSSTNSIKPHRGVASLNIPPVMIPLSACRDGLQFQDFSVAVPQLQRVLLDGFNPHHRNQGSINETFRSHFDWHSSVHAHWALLKLSRLAGDTATYSRTMSRLPLDELQRVRTKLQEDSKYEMPYGRSWLALLLNEIQNHSQDSDVAAFARDFKNELANQVLVDLQMIVANRLNAGSYNSWVGSLFLLRASGTYNTATTVALNQFFESQRAELNRLASRGQSYRGDFLSNRALASLLSNTSFSPTSSVNQALVSLRNSALGAGHDVGLNISETWAVAKGASRNRQSCEAFLNRMNQILRRPNLWAEDFDRLSHWTPQFLVMAISIATGETFKN